MRIRARNLIAFPVVAMILSVSVWTSVSAAGRAEVLLKQGACFRGLAVLSGHFSEELLRELLSGSELLVHVLEPNKAEVQGLRKAFGSELGLRLVVEEYRSGRLPHADNLLDVVFLLPGAGNSPAFPIKDVLRALRPGGRLVVLFGSKAQRKAAAAWRSYLREAPEELRETALKQTDAGFLGVVTKPLLEGTDSWSHWEHSPDNNPISHDKVIRAPYRTQWIGGPLYSSMPVVTTAAGGRIFTAMGHIAHHVREEPWLNTLMARNGYNGTVLWQRKLPDGYLVHRSAFIATPDAFFLLDGDGCLVLDPETGRVLRRIWVHQVWQEWKYIALVEDTLYFLAGRKPDPAETTVVRSPYSHWSWGELSPGYYQRRVPWGKGRIIGAYSLKEDRLIWLHQEIEPIDSRAIAIGGGKIFFYCPNYWTGCIDRITGKVLWRNSDKKIIKLIEQPGRGLVSTPGFRTSCYIIYTPKAIVFQAQTRMNVVAVSPKDGHLLWTRKKTSNNPNMLYAEGHLIVGVGPGGRTLALNPETGQTVEDLGFAKRSCARLTGTPDSFFCRGMPEGLTRFDRATRKVFYNGALRPACNDGVIGANGLLYIGPWLCDCNLSLMGTNALCSAGDFSPSQEDPDSVRLQKAETEPRNEVVAAVTPADWPTYRGSWRRGAASPVKLTPRLRQLWKSRPLEGAILTAPTTWADLVFAGSDRGAVLALEAATGRLKWIYWTAGPINQPPTIAGGVAYVGSGDGWLYALDASTGALKWRFRIAPVERRITFFGKIASNWPVTSGVLVHKGVVYAAGGIIDYDGTAVYALDARNGTVIWRNTTCGHLDPALRKGVSVQGFLTIAQGRLWMPGGNVISPAAFDLRTGECLTRSVGNGSPRSNRGEEIGLCSNDLLIFGGRLHFSALRNVVNSANFVVAQLNGGRLGPRTTLCQGRIPPAWDEKEIVMVGGRRTVPACVPVQTVRRGIRSGRRLIRRLGSLYRRQVKWRASELEGSDTVALALTPDWVVGVSERPRQRSRFSVWQIWILDRENGKRAVSANLPGPALPGSLAIDRKGRILLVLLDGTIACFK